MSRGKPNFVILIYLLGMVAVHALVFWNAREQVRKGYSDFSIYYCAATIVRQGLGHQLYDDKTQFAVQRNFAPDVLIRHGALPFTHPPTEAAFFVPFSFLSYPAAFVLWDLVNLVMLMAVPFLLRPYLPHLSDYQWPVFFLALLAFFPIFFSLLQGQDAILLLFLFILAFIFLKRREDALAGVYLALGMFKFHLVLPFVVILIILRRNRVLLGFVPAGAVLAAVSVMIVGWKQILSYPSYVVHLENIMAGGAIVPSLMPNLRGLLFLMLASSPYLHTVILVASIAVFLAVAWLCRTSEVPGTQDLKFCLALFATVFCGYHTSGYDLSVLALPLALLIDQLSGDDKFAGWPKALTLGACALLCFSPLQLLLLMRYTRLALAGWIVLFCMVGIGGEILRRSKHGGESGLTARPNACEAISGV